MSRWSLFEVGGLAGWTEWMETWWGDSREEGWKEESRIFQQGGCFQKSFTPIKCWNLEVDLNLDFRKPKS